MSKTQQKPAAKTRTSRPSPAAEWIAAGIGFVLVLATVGAIGFQIFTEEESPPDITVHRLEVRPVSGGFVMKVRVKNRGGSPAAAVTVEGELTAPSGEKEAAEALFDFVPDHSSREGGLFFSADPRQGELALRAKGYADP